MIDLSRANILGIDHVLRCMYLNVSVMFLGWIITEIELVCLTAFETIYSSGLSARVHRTGADMTYDFVWIRPHNRTQSCHISMHIFAFLRFIWIGSWISSGPLIIVKDIQLPGCIWLCIHEEELWGFVEVISIGWGCLEFCASQTFRDQSHRTECLHSYVVFSGGWTQQVHM